MRVDLFYQMQGIFIGLLGWAATALLLNNVKISTAEHCLMIVCSWTIWMIPATGTLVSKGIITSNTAITFCALSTLALAFVVSISAIRSRARAE
jgi:hypothetical protein